MTHHRTFKTAVAALLCIALSACHATPSETQRAKMTTETQQAAKPPVRTICMGRFLIDLPAGATPSGNGLYKYSYDEVEPPTVVTHAQFEANVAAREAQIKATKHETEPTFLRQVIRPDKDSHIFVAWELEFSTAMLMAEGFRWTNGAQFWLKKEVGASKEALGIAALKDLLPRLRPRAIDDIPTDPGYCFNGGFIANDQWKFEEAGADFGVPEHPDLNIGITIRPLDKRRHDKPLLDRFDGGLQTIGRLFSSVHVLRKGERQLGAYKGQEYLITAPNDSEQRAHMFTWETQGEGTLETPLITIKMTTGHRDDDGNPQKTKLTDEQAMKLWDSIISTFRLRPTSAPPTKVSEAAPPLTPLGELAATGRTCPQTGWWQCTEEALPVKGGKKQFFRQGESMPRATLVGEPSMWQRVKGEAPEHRVATVWKLVEYKASERTPDAIAHAGDPKADQPASGAGITASTEPTIAAAEDAEPNDNGQAPPPKDA